MLAPLVVVSLLVAGPAPPIEDAHTANPVYPSLVTGGIEIDGQAIRLPEPRFVDGQPAAVQRAELVKIAGSERAVSEFLRDSVSAPLVVRLRDEPTRDHLVRQGDVWFAVHADFETIDPDALGLKPSDSRPVEAGNMRFTSRILEGRDLASRGIEPPRAEGLPRLWYVHLTGRLLDRIHVEETEQVAATRSDGSWVFASRTDPRFGGDDVPEPNRNQWRAIVRRGAREEPGPPHPFFGGASYVKISRLAHDPGVLLAEAHFAFAEPRPWFDGAPILRSKIGLIAQDQVRQLRRELARRKARPEQEKPR